MMKIALNKLLKNEKGQALPIVLILLLIGGLIIGSLLGFMSTGVKAGQIYEERMEEFYAADAGVEDALYKILSYDALLPQNVGDNWTPDPIVVNGKDVTVDITLDEDVESFLEELLGEDAGPHDEWTLIEEVVGAGTYDITVTYSGAAEKKKINGVGAWLGGDYEYVAGSATGMTDDYPVFTFTTVPYKGGTAFVWEWTAANRPEFGTATGVYERSLSFQFTPEDTSTFYFSWLVGGSMDIGVVPGAQTYGTWKVTAIATDSATSKQTTVTVYVSSQGEGAPLVVRINAWEVDLQ